MNKQLRDRISYVIDKRELRSWVVDAVLGVGDPGRAVADGQPTNYTCEEVNTEIDLMIADKIVGIKEEKGDADYWLCN